MPGLGQTLNKEEIILTKLCNQKIGLYPANDKSIDIWDGILLLWNVNTAASHRKKV